MLLIPFPIIILLLHLSIQLSNPLISPIKPQFQTGRSILFSSILTTSPSVYTISFPTPMSTTSLNTTLSIIGLKHDYSSNMFGFMINSTTVNDTAMMVEVNTYNEIDSPLRLMRVGYMVTSKTQIRTDQYQFVFDPASDNVMNSSVTGVSIPICIADQCKGDSKSLNYDKISGTPKVYVFITGYRVQSMALTAGNQTFGLGIRNVVPSDTSCSLDIYVYGHALLRQLTVQYISFELEAVNVMNNKLLEDGLSRVGCDFTINTWTINFTNYMNISCIGNERTDINTTLTTSSLQFPTYYPQNFMLGFNYYISGLTPLSISMSFDITSTTAVTNSGSTTYDSIYDFSGPTSGRFSARYPYFILLQFYCDPLSVDKYYVNGQNKCDSACNSIGQYYDLNNYCKDCDPICYKCYTQPYLCTACNITQNRVLSGSGNLCICDPNGYYDDLSSLICPKCHHSCQSCTGPSLSQCISCPDPTVNFRTTLIDSCPCITGYFDNGVKICVKCHYTCYTCSGGGISNCVTCNLTTNFRAITTLSTCPCIAGYFNVGSNPVCSKCHYSCYTCSGSLQTSCTQCNTTADYRTALTGNKCPCSTGYFDDGNATCKPCHLTCLTCLGPGPEDCKTCPASPPGLRALQSGYCKCKKGYFDYLDICYPCHYSCYNCTAGTTTSCINCNDPTTFRYYIPLTKQCLCKAGYFDVVNSSTCQLCDPKCKTCVNTTLTCLSCDSAKFRQLSGTSCLCIMGYTDTLLVNGSCSKCHYSCQSCFGTSDTQCSTCITSIRNLTANSCPCPAGQFDNGINVTCELCHPQCKTCSDRYDYTCTGCQITYMREVTTMPTPGPCKCMIGYFENNNALVCDSCFYTCLTCSAISTNCTSCDKINQFRQLSVNSQCLCISHYFDVGNPICQTCVITCSNCSILPDNCTSCYNDRYLSGNVCLCKNGLFENTLQICTVCSYSCLTCQTSSTNCLTCPLLSSRTLYNGTCPCNDNYYDNVAVVCLKCPYYCNNCVGPTATLKCLACPLLSYRTLQSTGICTCNFGYYDDGVSPVCKVCKATCESCSSYSVCLTCYAAQFRTPSGGVCKCNASYYDNLVNAVCQACHYSCATCTGPLATNCLTCSSLRSYTSLNTSCPCSPGFYQFLNTCNPCSTQCLTCSILPSNCTSCSAGDRYLSNNICLCKEGFYDNGGVCIVCDVRCRTCLNAATNCLACNITHMTTLSGPSCICSNIQYQDPTTLICTSCHYSCYQCTSGTRTSCSSCSAGNFRTFNPTNFTCDCNPGYFDNLIAKCVSCNSKCLTCYGPTQLNCLTCHTGQIKMGSRCQAVITCSLIFFYYQGQCITQCPNTTYPDANICQPCINNCKTCSSMNTCLSCVENYYFDSSLSTCNQICPISTYINYILHRCQPCPLGCALCNLRNNLMVCTQCMASYYLYDYIKCVDLTFCLSPDFVISSNYCFKCQFPCKTCTSLLFNGCLTCQPNYSFFNGQCLLTCPEGYYSNSANFCVTCEVNCLKCSPQKCEKCVNNFYLTPDVDNPKCIKQKYFYDSLTNSELPCHPNCFTCTNSSFSSCLICQKSRGDQSQLAISGYCDCWEDSLELGNGVCSKEEFESLQSYTKVLKSSSDSVFYLNVVAGLASANILTGAAFILYEQSYSNLYFVNSSIVLQSDLVLKQMLNRNVNFYLNRKKGELFDGKSNKMGNNIYQNGRRRRLVYLQNNFSLFTRGEQQTYKYLYQWSIYTILCIALTYLTIFSLNFITSLKLQLFESNKKLSTIINIAQQLCQQTILIFFHIFTISEITLYGSAEMKYFIENQNHQGNNIDMMKFLFSLVVVLYYFGYSIRLIVGVGKVHRMRKVHQFTYQQEGHNTKCIESVKILFVGFNDDKHIANNKSLVNKNTQNHLKSNKQKMIILLKKMEKFTLLEKLYIPIFIVRLILASICLIVFSQYPQRQLFAVVALFMLWFLYSLIWCPYGKVFRVFIHLNQIIYLLQLGGLLYQVSMQQGQSRLMPAYVIMSLNGLQLFLFILFSLVILSKTFIGLCSKTSSTSQDPQKNNKITNIFNFQLNNTNDELYHTHHESNTTHRKGSHHNLNISESNELLNPNGTVNFDKFNVLSNLFDDLKQEEENFDNLTKMKKEENVSIMSIKNQDEGFLEKQFKFDDDQAKLNNIGQCFQVENNNITRNNQQFSEENDVIVKKRYRVVKKNNKKD